MARLTRPSLQAVVVGHPEAHALSGHVARSCCWFRERCANNLDCAASTPAARHVDCSGSRDRTRASGAATAACAPAGSLAKSSRLGPEPAVGVRKAGRSTRSVWSSLGSPSKVCGDRHFRDDDREASALPRTFSRSAIRSFEVFPRRGGQACEYQTSGSRQARALESPGPGCTEMRQRYQPPAASEAPAGAWMFRRRISGVDAKLQCASLPEHPRGSAGNRV